MKTPSSDVLRSLVSLSGNSDWERVVGWLRASRTELTHSALQSADAKLCGAAYELQLILETLEGARERLEKLK